LCKSRNSASASVSVKAETVLVLSVRVKAETVLV